MKELNKEDKARRYDEISKEVKDFFEGRHKMSSDVTRTLEYLFPELREPEDEKIRKELIRYIKDSVEMGRVLPKYSGEWIAWLEKQDVSKSFWKPTEEQYEALTYAYNSCSDTERGNYYEGVLESLIEDLHRLDEQHPKFRVGDTIKQKSTGDIATISVVDLKNREYRLSNTGFIPFKYEHLWELVEQKPVEWSEEDERIYQSIMDDTVQENQLDDKQTKWLSDIKYRYFKTGQT